MNITIFTLLSNQTKNIIYTSGVKKANKVRFVRRSRQAGSSSDKKGKTEDLYNKKGKKNSIHILNNRLEITISNTNIFALCYSSISRSNIINPSRTITITKEKR